MNETKIETTMPRATPDTLHRDTVKLKPFADDYKETLELQKEAAPVARQLTVQEILREAIREGLPAVRKRYKAAVDAVNKTK